MLARPIRQVLQALALALAVAGLSRVARAERPSVAIVGPVDGLALQIRAELSSLGFQVVLLERSEPAQTPGEAQDAARAAGAAAAICVVPSAAGVRVWVVDRVTAKTSSRELERSDDAAGVDRLLAVRVVELLRASLLELALPEPTRGEVEPTPELRAAAGLQSPRTASAAAAPDAAAPQLRETTPGSGALLLDGGFGGSVSAGAGNLAPGLSVGAFWQPLPRASVGLSALVPLVAATLSRAEGSASIRPWQFAAAARLYPFAPGGSLEPSLGLGLAVLRFQIEGKRTTSQYQLRSEQLLVAGPHAELALRWRVSSRIALRSSLGLDYALTQPIVQFAGREVATLGQPLFTWSLGLEVRATSIANGDS
jgi:hypothetical protein